MSNLEKSIRVELTFSTSSEPLRLSFRLLDHAFALRWLYALMHSNEKSSLRADFNGALFVDEIEIRQQIEETAKQIESISGVQILKGPLPVYANADDFDYPRACCRKILESRRSFDRGPGTAWRLASRALQELARYESLYAPDHHFHIELTAGQTSRYFFNDDDFSLFSPDRQDGGLYLHYAQAGMSPLSAYLSKSESAPAPQDSFLPSFQLLYRETHSYSDEEKRRASDWVATRLKPEDLPYKGALGLIPLAIPTHSYRRTWVLEKLQTAAKLVKLEVFEGSFQLKASDVKKRLQNSGQRMRRYHRFARQLAKRPANIFERLWRMRWYAAILAFFTSTTLTRLWNRNET